jgi:large subunit ribosomal protein L22
METARAIFKFARISPTKARAVADLIRGLPVEEAAMQLGYSPRKAAVMLRKTLKSAVANAERVGEVRREQLKVVDVRVDDGPRLKRSKPKNKGGSHPIRKRMSHFTVVVGVKEG